jgi:hypothetical protein
MKSSTSSLKSAVVALPILFGGLGFTANAVAQEIGVDTQASNQQTAKESLTQSSNPSGCSFNIVKRRMECY